MVWQDFVITIANILFSYSLIFQAYKGFKNKKGYLAIQTSIFTTIGLYSMSIAFFTLSLYVSSIVSCISGTFWLILLIQRIKYGE